MKTIKTYGVYGLMEWEVPFTLPGGNIIKVNFTGGIANNRGVNPAKYITANAVVQYVIETSELYKSGRIKLISSISDDTKVPQPKSNNQSEQVLHAEQSESDASVNLTEIEVYCLDDAVAYLKEHYGVPSRNTRSKAAAERAGAEHGIVFIYKEP